MTCAVRLAAGLVAAAVALPAAAGQAESPRDAFVGAVGRFSLALEGAYGDEGSALLTSLTTARMALDRWDAFVEATAATVASQAAGAAPAQAARLHLALGGVYLDRLDVAPALAELTAAAELDPDRADVQALLAAAYGQLGGDPAAAAEAHRRAEALEPNNPIRSYLLARHLAATGDEEAARAARLRFLAADRVRAALTTRVPIAAPFIRLALVPEASDVEPFFPPARYAEGFAQLRRREYAAAIDTLTAAAARDPLVADIGPHRDAMTRASAVFRDGDADAAVAALTRAAALAPDRAEPVRLLGLVHAAVGRWNEAEAALRRAVALAPQDERARLALGEALFAAGRHDAAVAALEETIAAIPGSGRAHWVLARVHQRAGRYAEAIAAFERSLAFHPLVGRNGIFQTMGTLHAAQQRFDAAVAAYEARVDLHPNDAGAHFDLGHTYLRLGRHDEALLELSLVLLLDPWHGAAATELAQAYQRTGDQARAAEAAQRAVDLDPSNGEARYVLGTALVRLGRTEEGQRELAAFQRQQAELAEARTLAFELAGLEREATVLAAEGRHAEAVAIRRQMLARDDSAAARLALGVALLDAGQPAEAADHLDAAARRGAPPQALSALARAFDALGRTGDRDRAQAEYDRLRREALRQRGARR